MEWIITRAIRYMLEYGREQMEASVEAENEWTQHVFESAQETLFPTVDSWFMNVNRNLPEKRMRFCCIPAVVRCTGKSAKRLRRMITSDSSCAS